MAQALKLFFLRTKVAQVAAVLPLCIQRLIAEHLLVLAVMAWRI